MRTSHFFSQFVDSQTTEIRQVSSDMVSRQDRHSSWIHLYSRILIFPVNLDRRK